MTPQSVRLRVYQVGFGDCLLLTVRYTDVPAGARPERHVLIDYGTKSGAERGPSMAKLAPLIAEHCDGHLDAVVVSHRHADHVSGFGGSKAEEHLGALAPDLIIRPWPDGPAEPGAGVKELDEESRGFLKLLDSVAEHQSNVVHAFGVEGRSIAARVGQLAALGVPNQDALDMLAAWTTPDPTTWVRVDDKVDIKQVLPGVAVRVLGPPTLEQVPGMRSYASTSNDYWLGMTAAELIAPELTRADVEEVWQARELVAAPGGLGSAARLVEKMHDASSRRALDIVAGFDDVLNNTSVILLLTVGDRSLLLAGDAQVENWSYTLDRAYGVNGRRSNPTLRKQLESVDLYKVGHHGSRNATPRRLVDLWRSDRGGRPFCSVMSTKSGVFDETDEGTVPKQALIDALKELGPVRSTHELPQGVWWFDVEAPAKGPTAPWKYVAGPVVNPPPAAKPSEDEGDGPG